MTRVFLIHGWGGSPDKDWIPWMVSVLKEKGYKVNKVILVAPWFELTNLENKKAWQIANPWIKTKINLSIVSAKANSFITVFSDNDLWVPIDVNLKLFNEGLNPRVIVLRDRGHFTEDEGIKEIPELLNLV